MQLCDLMGLPLVDKFVFAYTTKFKFEASMDEKRKL